MRGRIIKADSGFYYVFAEERIYETKLRGKTKKDQGIAYPGDIVTFTPVDTEKGVIDQIEQRRNLMERPLVANSDQILLVMSLSYPKLDFNVLDRLLVNVHRAGLDPVLLLNKCDEGDVSMEERIRKAYPIPILMVSANTGIGIDELKALLKGKLSVLAGPSGVGKTSILNRLDSRLLEPTGSLGQKIQRGKHTTRSSHFYNIGDGLIADTPGFSRVDLPKDMRSEELPSLYPEYADLLADCQFTSCSHQHEAICAVKSAVSEGLLDQERYQRYIYLLEELKENDERRYK